LGEGVEILIGVNAAALVGAIGIGIKILWYLSQVDLKMKMLWEDYENRIRERD
jgi:hypothetical protein